MGSEEIVVNAKETLLTLKANKDIALSNIDASEIIGSLLEVIASQHKGAQLMMEAYLND